MAKLELELGARPSMEQLRALQRQLASHWQAARSGGARTLHSSPCNGHCLDMMLGVLMLLKGNVMPSMRSLCCSRSASVLSCAACPACCGRASLLSNG